MVCGDMCAVVSWFPWRAAVDSLRLRRRCWWPSSPTAWFWPLRNTCLKGTRPCSPSNWSVATIPTQHPCQLTHCTAALAVCHWQYTAWLLSSMSLAVYRLATVQYVTGSIPPGYCPVCHWQYTAWLLCSMPLAVYRLVTVQYVTGSILPGYCAVCHWQYTAWLLWVLGAVSTIACMVAMVLELNGVELFIIRWIWLILIKDSMVFRLMITRNWEEKWENLSVMLINMYLKKGQTNRQRFTHSASSGLVGSGK